MLFSSIEFIFVFLPITLIGYFLLCKHKNLTPIVFWLICCSLFFYAYWDLPYILLLLFSIMVNFLFGKSLMVDQRKLTLTIGIIFNLSLIGVFKYIDFLIGSSNFIFDLNTQPASIILPLAISFFTFQQIAYLVDVFRGDVKDTTIFQYIFFVSFFPQLIAGPIVHHKEIIPQLNNQNRDRNEIVTNLLTGLSFFIIGLMKKVLVADSIGIYADSLFSNPTDQTPGLIYSWIGVLAFSFQIYFDFSGYSDMAIGLARMLGIKLPDNFESPYKANNIIDFWRRWHITLSRFLKTYLYIPLGGNRLGEKRRYLNILITMLLGGLWHGAAWTFVFWGFLHGTFLIINHAWKLMKTKLGLQRESTSLTSIAISRAVTLLSVTIAWVFFRSDNWSDAFSILKGLIGLNGVTLPIYLEKSQEYLHVLSSLIDIKLVHTPPYQIQTLIALVILGIIVLFLPNTRQITTWVNNSSHIFGVKIKLLYFMAISASALAVLLVIFVRHGSPNDFIYMVF